MHQPRGGIKIFIQMVITADMRSMLTPHTKAVALLETTIDGVSYLHVPITVFQNSVREIGFDVFLALSDQNLAHIFSRSTGVDYKRVASYAQKGVSTLLVKAADRALQMNGTRIVIKSFEVDRA